MEQDAEAAQFLKEASLSVKKNAYFMRKAMDEDNLREALRYSAAMLGELRTSFLSPQRYYELYMQVFDELGNLEAYFADEQSKGRTLAELYELVQHAGNVLPRLYLMVAVGCLYIKAGGARSSDILKDLVEMTKGVQHPTRGLFLRAYLCQRSRGLLPDTGSPYAGEGGDIHDAVDFLLTNFMEMNKLWVRMQHQGAPRDRERREKERQQLQDLVGKNLTYISQLDGLTFELYAGSVLPRLLEQVVSCKDELAQQYLMQAVIQGFPDAFHLASLDALLSALPELQSGVKLHAVMASLMDRLARYAASDPSVVGQLLERHAFEKFVESISKVAELHGDIPAVSLVEMYAALMRFTEGVHPDKLENVNRVLGACQRGLAGKGLGGDAKAEKQLVALLSMPLGSRDAVTVLSLDQYPPLMGLLSRRTHKDMALKVVTTTLAQGTCVSSLESVEMLFKFIAPLVQEAEDDDDMDEEDIEEEQVMVARMLHQLTAPTPGLQFAILRAARAHLELGSPARLKHTYPALAFCGLKALRRLNAAQQQQQSGAAADADASADANGAEKDAERAAPAAAPAAAAAADAAGDAVDAESALQWLLDVALQLAEVPAPMQALRLLLVCAHVASEEAGLEMLAYEFFEQAFTLYEESVADSRHKVTALQAIVGTLHRCYVFSADNRDALTQSVTSYAAKLLKRADQCRAACAASHLAWQEPPAAAADGEVAVAVPGRQPPVRDAQKVMAGLKRALKVVAAAKQQRAATARGGKGGAQHLPLYVEIVNHYLYYLARGVESMSVGVVQQLLELVGSELSQYDADLDAETRSYWQATQRHIQCLKAADPDKYAGLNA
uniref:Vacuolar protein sorting-associated protein 35 n=1 Tax=Tetradesmus obliquus TaxID=3088 RepID=A0A383WCT9_TETOB|eukprot:jgi/Sobl393_1/160/SZX74899.1